MNMFMCATVVANCCSISLPPESEQEIEICARPHAHPQTLCHVQATHFYNFMVYFKPTTVIRIKTPTYQMAKKSSLHKWQTVAAFLYH